jgi:hypothetical protein
MADLGITGTVPAQFGRNESLEEALRLEELIAF